VLAQAAAAPQPPLAPSRGLWAEPDGEGPQVGGGNEPLFGLIASFKPLVKLERTDGPAMLDMDHPLGYEIGLLVADQSTNDDMMGRFSVSYTLMKEDADDDRPVHAYWIDWSGGFVRPFWDGPLFPAARWEAGVSFLFADYERDTYDTYGLGAVGRMALGVYTQEYRVGLEVSGDARGYVGMDGHGFQSAWGCSLGVSVMLNY
jgi:hypothetical protein